MKKIAILVIVLCICFSLFGYTAIGGILDNNILELKTKATELKTEITKLKSDILSLETERNTLENEIADIKTNIKVENGTAKYIITFNIKQSHLTFDIGQHIKDEMNDISIQIPVDKEYYDSVEVGDTIADDFRMGSFILYGSFGNWDVTVEDKKVQ